MAAFIVLDASDNVVRTGLAPDGMEEIQAAVGEHVIICDDPDVARAAEHDPDMLALAKAADPRGPQA